MLAAQLDYVVGVDSHRDSHALAVVAVATGVVLFEGPLPRTAVVISRRFASRASTLLAGVRSRLKALRHLVRA